MSISDKGKKQLSRRVFLIGGIQALAASTLLGRTAQLQFIQSEQYKTLSEENRIKLQIVPPLRGIMTDRMGKALAENRVNYRLFIERDNKKQAMDSFEKLMELIELSNDRADKLRQDIAKSRYHVPLMIKEHIDWNELARIQAHMPDLPAVYIEQGQLRYYPLAEHAAHLIGYVGKVSEEEKAADASLARLPEFQIGKNGAEQRFEKELRGKAGNRRIEVNALGANVRELAEQPYVQGETLRLTIDRELQEYAAKRLGEESGSVVVMDVETGGILACASMPAFDPNQFSLGIRSDYWKSLLNNPRNPLLNKAFSGMYPPASTFKMVVGLAGLEAGVITPDSRVYCPGHFRLGNQTFKCWKAEGHGTLDLAGAIAQSCDTYFYQTGRDTGIENIVAMASRMGLGASSGLQMLGEKSGLLPSDQWKKATYNIPWVKGDTINASIGQGYMLATPIQLAIMTARIVTNKQVKPTLIMAEKAAAFAPLDVNTAHLEAVMEGMWQVSNSPRGTAYWSRIKGDQLMAGKTGTAQVRRLLRRGVNQNTLPWEYRHHALFVGYFPTSAPRYTVSVVIEHGGGGSSAAAPVASDVLKKLQERITQQPELFA